MAFMIRTTDKPDSATLRAANRDAHLAYLEPFTPRVIAAGSFLEDDGQIGQGGLILFDTDERQEAEALVHNDPYYLAGLFAEVEVVRWRKVFVDGRRADG